MENYLILAEAFITDHKLLLIYFSEVKIKCDFKLKTISACGTQHFSLTRFFEAQNAPLARK